MADPSAPSEKIVGAWTHSHEEDRGDLLVFRPSDRDFPPARGRESFTLRPDGTLGQVGPGPDDRPIDSEGTWSSDGQSLELAPYGAPKARFHIEAVTEDRLVLTRQG